MSKCKYLIDISPYDPLCDHPCRLYGGGAVEAECETCQYRIEDLEAENAKLREQMERLVTLLRNDCDIDASWDGLRGFWLIGLTENGCLMRDRACKAEAENDKLRELVGDMMVAWWACDNERCPRHDKRCEEGKFCAFDECARDLGIEVDE